MLKYYHLDKNTYYRNRITKPIKDKYNQVKYIILSIRNKHKDYGSHRIFNELKKKNIRISYKKCLELYNRLNLLLSPSKKGKTTKKDNETDRIKPLPNLIKNLKDISPFNVLCTDGTEFNINGKIIHYAFIIDQSTRFILCYECSKTEDSTMYRKLIMKLSDIIPDLSQIKIFHTDQGSCFTARAFNKLITEFGFIHSMSAAGTPTDNCRLENFHGILKREIYFNKKYNSVSEFKKKVKEYIHYYNYDRSSYKEQNTPFERMLAFYQNTINIKRIQSIRSLKNSLQKVKIN